MEKIITALFFVFLVLFPFGQLTKIPLNFLKLPEAHLYLTDVILFLLVLSWGVWKIFNKKEKYYLPSLTKPIFIFFLIGLFSLIFNSSLFTNREIGIGFLYLLRWIFYTGLYFVIVDLKKRFNWLNWQNMKGFLIVIGSAIGVFGLIQYLLWPDLKALEVLQYDPHFYRVVGTFLDPGFTGIILVLTLILIVDFLWQKKFSIFYFLLFIILFLSLALTYSRASWLAFFAGMSVLAFCKKSWKIFLFTATVLVLTWFLIPQPSGEGGKLARTYTIQARLENYQKALKIFKEKPILGVGFNTLRYFQRNRGFLSGEEWLVSRSGAGIDNSWLFTLVTTGILGFLAYFGIWIRAIQIVKRLKKGKKEIFLASIGALFIHAFFLNSLFYPWVMVWIWILLAMV